MRLVVKIGGSVLSEGLEGLIGDLKGMKGVVLVHGGGREVTEVARRMGKEQKYIVSPSGIRSRYTDLETLEIFVMVMAGKINKWIVSSLNSAGIDAVGLCGVDGRLMVAKRKKRLIAVEGGRRRFIDGGYTGKIVEVNPELIGSLLEMGYTPVVAPIAYGTEGEMLNVDGDRAAAYVAAGIKADCVVFLTDVDGVILDGGLVRRLRLSELDGVMARVGFGMKNKVLASKEALSMGVKKAVISSGLVDRPLNRALEGRGTVIEVG